MLQTTDFDIHNPRPGRPTALPLKPALHRLCSDLIHRITTMMPTILEGVVMTPGPKPYRRIDCDGRALAYIRARPRRRAVRVDVSGLWVVPRDAPIRHPTASGSATLFIECDEDIDDVCAFLIETVRRTRAAYEAERLRNEARANARSRG